jgi:hypothetical protein
MYGIKHFTISVCIIIFTSCSPHDRFYRLVTKYPYLLDSSRQDKIVIRNSVVVDTQVVWKNKTDTLIFREAKIERRNDTFRFYFRERPCTTFIEKTQIVPSKIIERHYQEKLSKTQAWEFFKLNYHWLLIILFLLTLLIKK